MCDSHVKVLPFYRGALYSTFFYSTLQYRVLNTRVDSVPSNRFLYCIDFLSDAFPRVVVFVLAMLFDSDAGGARLSAQRPLPRRSGLPEAGAPSPVFCTFQV